MVYIHMCIFFLFFFSFFSVSLIKLISSVFDERAIRSLVRLLLQIQPSDGEILYRSPELGCQVHTVRPCLVTLFCVHGPGLEDVVWGLICVPSLAQGCVRNANSFQVCFRTTVPSAQVENGLLGSLQLPYGVEVRLVAVAVASPIGLQLAVEQRLNFLV